MIDKVHAVIARFEELGEIMQAPDFASDQKRMAEIGREYTDLRNKMPKLQEYIDTVSGKEESEQMLNEESDPELIAMAKEELADCKDRLPALEEDVKLLLVPTDPTDHCNAILEIRAGTGGTEAGLFAGDLLRMYELYAATKKWKVEVLSSAYGEQDAIKEMVLLISGENVYGTLKYESGIHRVQRVPKTEAQGRIHTSAASVAVLLESDDVEINIEDKDLRIDTFRASGAGGQHVNKTDSAIRITHIPSGLVVSCQDEKSQTKNKARAMKVLQARLLDEETRKQKEADDAARKSLVGSGDRSEKIRTYNYPQGRVTDHRINFTAYNLDQIMNGSLQPFSDALAQADMQDRMANSDNA